MKNTYKINISKNFTVDEVADFRLEANKLMDKELYNLVINFSQCEFIDSTGLGALVSIYKKCIEKKGSVVLEELNQDVQKLFKLTRLDKVFEIR